MSNTNVTSSPEGVILFNVRIMAVATSFLSWTAVARLTSICSHFPEDSCRDRVREALQTLNITPNKPQLGAMLALLYATVVKPLHLQQTTRPKNWLWPALVNGSTVRCVSIGQIPCPKMPFGHRNIKRAERLLQRHGFNPATLRQLFSKQTRFKCWETIRPDGKCGHVTHLHCYVEIGSFELLIVSADFRIGHEEFSICGFDITSSDGEAGGYHSQ